MTARDHCPTCRHRHQRGPTGRLVCGGDDGTCKCDPADPCRCGVCEMARASRAERKPSAGWVDRGGLRTLGDRSHIVRGAVRQYVDGCDWSITVPGCDGVGGRYGKAPTLDAAKLAAEDALLAIAAEIVGAVGRSAAVNARRLVEEYGNACAAAPAAISACVDGGCDAVDSMTSTIDRGNAARDELLRALGVETP